MERAGVLAVLFTVLLSAALVVPAWGASVEVGNLSITGEPGTDGLTFPDGSKQVSAVIGTGYQRPISACPNPGEGIGAIALEGGVVCYPFLTSASAVGGSGITTTGTTDVQIGIDEAVIQKRISNSCGQGFMTAVDQDGMPTCVQLSSKIVRQSCNSATTCSCPNGGFVVGGGAACPTNQYYLAASYPSTSTQWLAQCAFFGSAVPATPALVYALCLMP